MDCQKLDNEELLRLAIDAISTQRQADGLVLLKTVLERDPANTSPLLVLAGQHAQLGLMDRAEAGFRQVLHACRLTARRFPSLLNAAMRAEKAQRGGRSGIRVEAIEPSQSTTSASSNLRADMVKLVCGVDVAEWEIEDEF